MNESFEIHEKGGTVELKASGQLTENTFRLYLLKLLQLGKSKSFKLNLRQASEFDTSCMQLVRIFKRELAVSNVNLVIVMPEEPTLKSLLIKGLFTT